MIMLFKFFKHKPLSNLLLLINIAVSCALLTAIVMMLVSAMGELRAAKNFIGGNVLYLQSFDAVRIDERLEEQAAVRFGGKISVHRTHTLSFKYQGEYASLISYSDKVADMLKIDFKKGRMPKAADEIAVADGAAHMGEIIEVMIGSDSYSFKVVGLIGKGNYYLRTAASSTGTSLSGCFLKTDSNDGNAQPAAFASEEFMKNCVWAIQDRNVIVTFDSVSDGDVMNFLNTYGYTANFKDMAENTRSELSELMKLLAPIAVFSIMLCLSSGLINTLMIFNNYISDLAILFINGYSLNRIRLICAAYNGILAVLALALGYFVAQYMTTEMFYSNMGFGFKNYLSAVIYIAAQQIIVFAYQNKIMDKRKLVQIMHGHEE